MVIAVLQRNRLPRLSRAAGRPLGRENVADRRSGGAEGKFAAEMERSCLSRSIFGLGCSGPNFFIWAVDTRCRLLILWGVLSIARTRENL
jgi:hypothetical protein